MSARKLTVGFVGTGVMGNSMAGHLLRAGHPLTVNNRTRTRAESLISAGATWSQSPAGVAAASELVVTMVGFPSDVEEVYFGPQGLFTAAEPGALFIDMTTSSPVLARRIHDEARRRKVRALDAPVSGGDVGAREARLSIMVGGDREDFASALPVFAALGTAIYQGEAGSGQHTKMCNQIAVAAAMIGACEALAYAIRAGLDPETVLKSISGGAAGSWTLSNLAPRMLAQNFAPGFYVKHFVKDIGIALGAAKEMGLELPGLSLAKSLYDRLSAAGGDDQGTQALFRLYIETALQGG